MKVKYVIAFAVALLLTGFTTAALAQDPGTEDFTFAQSLGTSINATDIWSVQCGVNTATVRANVNDNGQVDGVRMRVTVLDLRGRSVSAVSPDNGTSALVSLSGGPGHYLVIIQKAAFAAPATVEAYDSTISCRNAFNLEVTTNILRVQNQ